MGVRRGPAVVLAMFFALFAPAGVGADRSPHTRSATKTECCFLVAAHASGSWTADYGVTPKPSGLIGTEGFKWDWSARGIVEYTETNGKPSAVPPPSARGVGTGVGTTSWSTTADEAREPTKATTHCEAGRKVASKRGVHDVIAVIRAPGSPFEPRFKKQAYLFQLSEVAGVLPASPKCLASHHPAPEAPPRADGSVDEARRPFGPRHYALKLLPHAFLLQSEGAATKYTVRYSENRSFVHGRDSHRMTELSKMQVTISWFSPTRLDQMIATIQKQIRR